MTKSTTARQGDAVRRTANNAFEAWEKRTALMKPQSSAESAANDAKTSRLKPLRLEKERQDALQALLNPAAVPQKRPASKRVIAN